MTKIKLLVELYEREKYNLSCYSADYMLQKAKKGFEVQYNEHKKSWIYWLKLYPITSGQMTMADLLFWLFMLLVSWILHLSD